MGHAGTRVGHHDLVTGDPAAKLPGGGRERPGLTLVRLKADAECPTKLRRIAIGDAAGGGATLGYIPCYVGSCPVALVRGRKMTTLAIDGLSEMRLCTIAGEQVVIGTALIVHTPQWTEGTANVLHVEGDLKRGLVIQTSELDTRGVRHHLQQGELTLEPDQLRYTGVERWVSALDNTELGSRPVSQIYRLANRAKK